MTFMILFRADKRVCVSILVHVFFSSTQSEECEKWQTKKGVYRYNLGWLLYLIVIIFVDRPRRDVETARHLPFLNSAQVSGSQHRPSPGNPITGNERGVTGQRWSNCSKRGERTAHPTWQTERISGAPFSSLPATPDYTKMCDTLNGSWRFSYRFSLPSINFYLKVGDKNGGDDKMLTEKFVATCQHRGSLTRLVISQLPVSIKIENVQLEA